MLRYTVRGNGAEVLVVLEGELARDDDGLDWTDRLRDFLEEHFINDGVRTIRLDLGGVTLIDHDGVGTLLVLNREAVDRGKALWIENPSGQVRNRLASMSVLGRLTDDR